MGQFHETLGTINTTLRTILMLILVGVSGLLGYKGYEIYNEPRQKLAQQQARLQSVEEQLKQATGELAARQRQIDELTADVAEKTARLERLDLSLRLLKVRRRLARLTVLEQREQADATLAAIDQTTAETATAAAQPPTRLVTRVEFVEINDQGSPIGEPKQFDILGDMIYIDYLQVTFSDQYIEQADLDRSTAIALFQRIFGEYQEPSQGFRIDTVGTRPTAYGRGTQMSDFERKIWDDFWLIANDRQRAEELGIHAAHRTAVGIRAIPGMKYDIELRATGPLSIRPVDEQAPDAHPGP
jgi:multidrug efflux pump subunit AcrA (membrane-fusion protein)